MERVMTVLTDKHQAMVRPIGITGMSTHRASLARVVGIHLDGHAPAQEGFVGNHALQLGKRPLGVGSVGLPLLLGRFLAMLAPGSLSDVCQVLQPDKTTWVSGHDGLSDHMIGVGFQPSLSSTDDDQSSRGGTSAFLLQTLSQLDFVHFRIKAHSLHSPS